VVVVNESFVKAYLPGEKALGKRILVEKIAPSRHGLGPLAAWEIVGVVADEKADGVDQVQDVAAYASFAQDPVVGLGLVARGTGDAGTLIRSIQMAIWRFNKNQVLDAPMTMERIKEESLTFRRLPAVLGRFRSAGDVAGLYRHLRRALFCDSVAQTGIGHKGSARGIARSPGADGDGRRIDFGSRRNRAWPGRRGRTDSLHPVDAVRHGSAGHDDHGDGSPASPIGGTGRLLGTRLAHLASRSDVSAAAGIGGYRRHSAPTHRFSRARRPRVPLRVHPARPHPCLLAAYGRVYDRVARSSRSPNEITQIDHLTRSSSATLLIANDFGCGAAHAKTCLYQVTALPSIKKSARLCGTQANSPTV
jgi:hypothetical protein